MDNTAEHIMEVYFRVVKNCFTISDVKIENGEGRQFDILAYNLKNKECYHIELSISHRKNFRDPLSTLAEKIRFKFFGKPRKGTKKPKEHLDDIKNAYKKYGVSFKKVQRIWCCWELKETNEQRDFIIQKLCKDNHIPKKCLKLLSFKNEVIPALQKKVDTKYYQDEILRTLSFIKHQ